MAGDEFAEFLPPSGPPTILNLEQVQHLRRQGWLQLELPADLRLQLHELSTQAQNFFDLDHAEKEELYPRSHGTECGFYHVPDEKEYLTFRHIVHKDSGLDQQASKTWHRVGLLLYRVLCDLSRACYYDLTAWDSMVEDALEIPKERNLVKDTITLLRLFRYKPSTGIAGEHVDVGLLTLCVGDGKGLQVLDRSLDPPQYIDVDGPVILIADMVRVLLGNRVPAGRHRVVGNSNGRTSIVFALRPSLKGVIDLSQFGSEGTVGAKELFYKIKGSKTNINATKDIRDKQTREKELRRQQIESEQLPEG